MEELVAGTIDHMISGADKEVLVEVVKYIQKQGLIGCRGDWKDFLNSHDRKFGDSLSDPSKRTVDVLAAFLKSFNKPKDLMVIGKIFRGFRDNNALEKSIMGPLDDESPEQRLVRLTMEHPNYRKCYSFYSCSKDWLIMPPVNIAKAKNPNHMLAIDCEMVLCKDGAEEVVKVCLVDEKLKVKLEKLVNPNKAVADYRTAITGISAGDLEGVTCSLADIQACMKNHLKHGIVLVGHSVHNDLRALKIAYQRVIDTSYIFKFSDFRPTYTPSLNNLCKTVLGKGVRKEGEPHNCRNDAEAAMKLVLAKLEHGFHDPIKLVLSVPDANYASLFLHKIPLDVPCQELKNVFPQDLNFDIKI